MWKRAAFESMRRMLAVFEVHLAPGSDPDTLLTPEIIQETQAQVMTPAEANAVGFARNPADAPANIRHIALAKRDAAWIHRRLEVELGRRRVHRARDRLTTDGATSVSGRSRPVGAAQSTASARSAAASAA